jgi:hypothetical protein
MSSENDSKQNSEKQTDSTSPKRRSTPQAAGGNPRSRSDDKQMTPEEVEEARARAAQKKSGG